MAGKEVKNLKSKLDGEKLDLSLSDLTVVPVREIMSLKKVTDLDLSSNHISSLPDDFCNLRNLTKLDLGSNKLRSLPENFGKLENLVQLDLYKNNLETLPVSFCHLKQLRFLDVKDNPLEATLKKVAGDCLDAKQCKEAATKVVQHMQKINADKERIRQEDLKKQRALEAAEKSKEDAAKQAKAAEKKKDKERRKGEAKQRDDDKYVENSKETKKEESKRTALREKGPNKPEKQGKSKKGRGFLGCVCCLVSALFFTVFFVTLLSIGLAGLLYSNCSQPSGKEFIPKTRELCQDLYQVLQTGRMPEFSWDYAGSWTESTAALKGVSSSVAESVSQFDYVGWKNTLIDLALTCRDTVVELAIWTYQNGSEMAKPILRQLAEWFWLALAFSIWAVERVFQYAIKFGQWTIETVADVVNNFPAYWEKVKYYWKNMK